MIDIVPIVIMGATLAVPIAIIIHIVARRIENNKNPMEYYINWRNRFAMEQMYLFYNHEDNSQEDYGNTTAYVPPDLPHLDLPHPEMASYHSTFRECQYTKCPLYASRYIVDNYPLCILALKQNFCLVFTAYPMVPIIQT